MYLLMLSILMAISKLILINVFIPIIRKSLLFFFLKNMDRIQSDRARMYVQHKIFSFFYCKAVGWNSILDLPPPALTSPSQLTKVPANNKAISKLCGIVTFLPAHTYCSHTLMNTLTYDAFKPRLKAHTSLKCSCGANSHMKL